MMSSWRDPASQIDFREAAEAIRQVITFVRSLPQHTNNCTNTERRIQQHKIQRANTGSRATMSPWAQSSDALPLFRVITDCRSRTLSPTPLPPPGVGAYRPPMLREAPPHLEFKSPCLGATLAAAPSTPPVTEADSCCRVATPVHVASPIDASTQAEFLSLDKEAVDPDMEIPQEIHKKSKKFQKIQKKFPKILSQLPMVIPVTPSCML